MAMKMQPIKIASIEVFFDHLLEDELVIVEKLRSIVLECLPQATEKMSFNVPFYANHYSICFIWPGSIAWGKSTQKGVRFGFAKGYLLDDYAQILDKGDRKQVYYLDFSTPQEIPVQLLKEYLFQAALVDEELRKLKKGSNRKLS